MTLPIPHSLLAFPLTALLLFVLLRSGLAWRLAVDHPNHRSLHVRPVPRIGGIAIVVAVIALAATRGETLLLGLAGGLCLLSFADDRWGLPVLARFAGHFVAAGLLVTVLPLSPLLAAALAVPVLVWMTNLYNFMDGANGLAGGMALFGFSAYGLAAAGDAPLALTAWTLAAAAAGFLLFNFHPARVFMGDGGSVPLGFLAGGIGLVGWSRGLWPLWFPLLVFSPFVIDATVTLARRGLRGEKVWQAHREHYYQRLVQLGWSHRRLALHEYALMAALTGTALLLIDRPVAQQLAGLGVWGLIFVALMVLIDRRWQHHLATETRS